MVTNPPMPMRSTLRTRTRALPVLVVAIVLGLGAASCADADTDTSPATSPTTPVSATGDASATSTRSPTTGPSESSDGQGAGCASPEVGITEFETVAGGPATQVRVFVPPGLDRPAPVVLNWHGLGSNGVQQSVLTAYEELAETEGFIAVHPTGGANSWELAQFDVPGRDDLAMVDDLIDRLVGEHCADPSRVYSTGMSNGGYFTALLVCERAERIAAAVSVAGVSHPDGCQPARPVPFIAFHGTADTVVPFDGVGRSSLESGTPSDALSEFLGQSMPDEFAEFAADFGCAPTPESVAIGDEVTRRDYLGCVDGVPLSFYEIADGGHTWPGSSIGAVLDAALGRTTDQVDATVVGWEFMSRFSLAEPGDG